MKEKERWYTSTWFTILMLIFVFPVGLFLMWRYKPYWRTWIKIVITVVIAIGFLNGCVINKDNEKKDNEPKTEQKADKEKELEEKEKALKEREKELKQQEEKSEKEKEGVKQTTDNNSDVDNNQTQSSNSRNNHAVQQHQSNQNNQAQQQPDAQAAPATPQPTRSYPNCKALRQDYPGGVSQGHPAYSTNLDRDGDGTACEAKGN